GNWALGGGTSNSWGNRDITGDIENDLHDHVAQGTSFVRSQRSTVIVQATQAERDALQTRRVANHNHCHALTIQYYEVLRHYRLETHYVGRRNAILIPFKPITQFTSALALQFRTLVERALLDERLSSCFDALIRLAIGDAAYENRPAAATAGSTGGAGSGETATDEFFTGEEKNITVDSATFSKPTGLKIEKGSTVTISARLGPEGEIKFGQGQFSGFGLRGGGATDARCPAPDLPAGALVAEVSGDQWMVGFGSTHVAKEEGDLELFFNDFSPGDNKGTAVADVTVRRPEPRRTVPAPKRDESPEAGPFTQRTDRICEERLLRHLNANLGHYNRAVWMLMDPAQRRMYLEEALGGSSELLYGIDDVPLTVSGNRVVFPFNGPMPKAAWFEEKNPKPRMSVVTLPTRGLFAEAQLGHCNACEVRDITRMSDWTEMTTEEPPAISGITPGPRGEMPQLTPTQLPGNVIQITQPPEAPTPTGVSAALGLLGAANVFRDMSALNEASTLLGKLA
ncbi:MAG: hypothetical protein M3290_13780, partial [Actinomycetota bacterium]|nr:hypothetical protein [Actinomycetota bacterium]